MRKTLNKITCGMLAAISVFGCASTLTACETSHPEVKMVIKFNGETYKLEYKLDRESAPQTVKHFLWLADNDYYDNLCVHNYSQNDYLRMYTGAYEYEDGNLVYKDYYKTISESKDFKNFPISVWMQQDKVAPMYTLKGEFAANNFRLKNGSLLKETFGSLTMYYHDFSDEGEIADSDVYMLRADGKDPSKADYKYNSATSMFYISLSNTSIDNKAYCTFATLKSGSKDNLEDLKEALDEYIEATYNDETDSFTESKTEKVTICKDYHNFGTRTVQKTYSVPKEPIIIESVKVTKY